MIKRLLTALLALAFVGLHAQTRPGSLKGKVSDRANGETIPFAIVLVKQGETVIASGQTDFDGAYNINPLNPGKYDVFFKFAGFADAEFKKVIIEPDRPRVLNVQMQEATEMLQEVVIEYEAPLIDGTKTATTVSGEDMVNMATRSIAGVAAQTTGVTQNADGSLNIRGGRSNTTVYFIDGVKVRGTSALPQAAIASTTVITGGQPAQYGDATGGIISVTTKGPPAESFGSVEYLSSAPFTLGFDNYNYQLLGLTLGGPIWSREKTSANGSKSKQTIAGYLLAGEFQSQDDGRPFAVDVWKVRDDVLADIKANPVRPAIAGIGVLNRTEFLTKDDFETQDYRENARNWAVRLTGNLNFRTSDKTNLSIGGRFNRSSGTNVNFAQSLFNYENYGEYKNQDWSTFVRFQQRFSDNARGEEESKTQLITNAFYSIQMDYTRNNRLNQDGRFGDNFFAYGHVGRFTTYQRPFYGYGQDTASGLVGWLQLLDQDTAVYFEPSAYNPVLANYTSAYYGFLNDGTILGSSRSRDDLLLGNALWNGFGPSSAYGLWGNVGAVQSGYSQSQASQFRVTASSSFNIKDHEIILGFEYEQRVDRAYSLAPFGMWSQMYLMQNDHIQELDLGNPMPVLDAFGVFQDTINYPRLINLETQYTFDRNVRKALGLDPDGMDILDIDSYDPELFSLDMWSADELINLNGSNYVGYYGYDYKGNILSNKPSLSDFFTQRDANGDFTRNIAPFEPIYIAGYIQDQFTFDDLFLRVGVRVDRYDANQPVLKDSYVLYPTRTVGDLGGTVIGGKIASGDIKVPNVIGDDFVVYVNDLSNPTDIVGYRNGSVWYEANGSVSVNPKNIADASTAGGIQPYLFEPDDQSLSAESFVDYEPQVNVMPRISFNFPISDEALFLAHYDVLVQRPDAGLARLDLLEYMRLQIQDNGGQFNNPNLLPQKTTNYELGFQQKLTDRSSLTISAAYREMRDMMQTVSLNEAYPITYVTYGNVDFGTVKSLEMRYDLRRTGNVKLTAAYTLQFAQGSGSGPNSGANIARSGQPNLRYILPLSYDVRHTVTVNFDYRYGSGKSYDGPLLGEFQLFEGMGLNLLINGSSGRPYSRRVQAYSLTAGSSSVQLDGQVNGSRRPWQVDMQMRIDREIPINKNLGLNVYVQILNVLDRRNVFSVYPYTGSAEDDGYLTSAQAQNVIQSQVNTQSFIDLYNIRMVNPFNFSLPRRIRLGMLLNF